MNRFVLRVLPIVTWLLFPFARAETESATSSPPPKVRYKAGQDVNFEQLLINGEIKRPELTVVTGNVQQGTDGLLRLRENFTDRVTMDAGEELK